MSIESLHATATNTTRRLLVAAGIFVLLAAVPGDRLAAQSRPGVGDSLAAKLRQHVIDSALVKALRESIVSDQSRRCLTMRVVPGDTSTRRTMPRASGDSLADPRMPRRLDSPPSCDRVAAAPSTAARPLRSRDVTSRPLPPTKVPFPTRP